MLIWFLSPEAQIRRLKQKHERIKRDIKRAMFKDDYRKFKKLKSKLEKIEDKLYEKKMQSILNHIV